MTALTDQICETMLLDALKDAVENGMAGVRKMSNEALEGEWLAQFGVPLEITDPESNPYMPPLEERL